MFRCTRYFRPFFLQAINDTKIWAMKQRVDYDTFKKIVQLHALHRSIDHEQLCMPQPTQVVLMPSTAITSLLSRLSLRSQVSVAHLRPLQAPPVQRSGNQSHGASQHWTWTWTLSSMIHKSGLMILWFVLQK